jgi:hypothetical protein
MFQHNHKEYILAVQPYARAHMKQDIHLIRAVLAAIQQSNETIMSHPVVPGYTESQINRHIELLHDGGYVDVSGNPTSTASGPKFIIRDLSVKGHEFVGMVLNGPVWNELVIRFENDELSKLPLPDIYDACRRISREWMNKKIDG